VHVLTIRDGCFLGKNSATFGGDRYDDAPLKIKWSRVTMPPADVFTDICIPQASDGLRAVAWLIEPPSMPGKDGHYQWVEERRRAFRFALTYRADLLGDPFYRFYPHGGAWVRPAAFGARKDSRVSIIASPKRLSEGHLLRHAVISRFGAQLHPFGDEYKPLHTKAFALLPYAFSVVIENWKADFYFTEKLIDAFLTRTVPIYWGCPSINRFFDPRGILTWDTLDQLDAILNDTSLKRYRMLEPFIEANYQEAMHYVCAEDWIARAYPDLFEGAVCES